MTVTITVIYNKVGSFESIETISLPANPVSCSELYKSKNDTK